MKLISALARGVVDRRRGEGRRASLARARAEEDSMVEAGEGSGFRSKSVRWVTLQSPSFIGQVFFSAVSLLPCLPSLVAIGKSAGAKKIRKAKAKARHERQFASL